MSSLKDKVVFGGLYRPLHNRWNNDQNSGFCVPVADRYGDLWMQNTYQIESPYQGRDKNTDVQIQRMAEYGDGKHDRCLQRARANFYHPNQQKIADEEQLDKYELVADLKEYRALKPYEDAREYNDEDILHGVKLFFEHGYSWNYGWVGVTLIRKDAAKNNACILRKEVYDLFSEMRQPYSSQYNFNKVTEALEKVEDNEENAELINRAKYAIELHHTLIKMEKDYDEANKALKERFGM